MMFKKALMIWMLLGLAGCSALAPRADPSRYFTLAALARPEETGTKEPAGGADALLGIGPIKFPGYLDRPELVTRSSPNRFEVAENDRWAEPLDENFVRVLSRNLAALMRTDRIVTYPWAVDRRPARQVEIEVLRFEANASHEAQLSARWTIIDGPGRKPLFTKVSEVVFAAKVNSAEGDVGALSEALAELSREIAKGATAPFAVAK